MSELETSTRAGEETPARPQSGLQILLVCVLFILIPVLLVLAVKYLFGA